MNDKPALRQNSTLLFIGFLTCLTVFSVFYGAGKSLWLDEAYSVLVAKQSFSGMLAALEHDAHPPLYYFLLAGWIELFGDGEIALRSLSGLFYTGGVFTIYLFGRKIYDERVGFLAAFLYALSPLASGTAHSARMYALLGFVSALSTLLFVEIFLRENNSRIILAAYICINLLGTFTQIWFFFLLAAQILTYLVLFYPKNRLKFFLLQFFSIIVFAVLWTPILLIQLQNNAVDWLGKPGLTEIVAVLLGFFGERVAVVFYLSTLVLLILSFKIWSKENRSEFLESVKIYFKSPATRLFVLVFAFSILVPFLVGQFKPVFGQTRYTIIALPALTLIFASLLCRFVNQTMLIIFCVFLLGLVEVAFVRFYNFSEPCSDRSVTARLLEKAGRGDVLIFTSSSRTTTDYYLDRFNRAGDFAEFTFPGELDEHPGFRNASRMLERREDLETEAENLIIRLHNLTAEQPRRIWLFYGLDPEVSDIIKRRIDENFVWQDKIDASCDGAGGRQADTFYTQVLLYREAAK